MSKMMIGFFIGLFIGVPIGLLAAAFCASCKRAGEWPWGTR